MKPLLLISTLAITLALATTLPAQEPSALTSVVDGNNQFAWDLYTRLGSKPGNKFFSSYSISNALAMTAAGAKGQTAKEMTDTLHLPAQPDRLAAGFGDLIHKLQGPDKKRSYQLDVANALWGQKTLPFRPEFLQTTQTHYQAGLHLVDFVKETDTSRIAINRWVEQKTNDKIKDLLQQGTITVHTRLVLVNAIYFKADWAAKFDKAFTRPMEFRSPGLGKFEVPMMNQTKQLQYGADDFLQVVQIPYKDNEVSMVLILPKNDDGLGAIEKKLSAPFVKQLLAKAGPVPVQLSLPKFKMTEEFQLADELQALGMKLPFTDAADFSGLHSASTLKLKIDKVVHKAFVDVDEKGTEAAAATAVTIVATSAPPPPRIFKADHPFLFLIRHNATGSILFMGRVVDPRGK